MNVKNLCGCKHAKPTCKVKAESDELHIRLPCKVGDILYQVVEPSPREVVCRSIKLSGKDKITITCRGTENYYYSGNFSPDSIGRTLFHTEEAAQEALERMKE